MFTCEKQTFVEDCRKSFREFRLVLFICPLNGTPNDGMNQNADGDARRRLDAVVTFCHV